MKLTIRECYPDWFIIERAEHDGRRWQEPTRHGTKLCTSARFAGNDSDVEGTQYEMMDIATAIKNRKDVYFTRCAVDAWDDELIFIWNPQNSNTKGEVSREDAEDLVKQIHEKIIVDYLK